MLLVILVVCIAIVSVGAHLYFKTNNEDAGVCLSTGGGIWGLITLLVIIVIGVDVSPSPYVNDKIAMYNSENMKIEEQVSDIVKSYMSHEKNTFSALSDKSPITLVTMFPELKSDALVAKQIDVYVANNEKIKELKLEAIDYKVQKWWLYFGN